MKKITYIFIITALLLGMLLHACFKPEGILIDKESKDYCLFAEGSYWIYQDSATHIIDSVVIDKPISYSFGSEPKRDPYRETYSTHISFYSQDSVSSILFDLTTGEADSDLKKPCLLRSYFFATMYHNGEVFEKFPNFKSLPVLVKKEDSYLINGITYLNVKIFEENMRVGKKRICYWAKNIGLIRTEIYKNDSVIVKNLIRYNVKQ